MRKSVGSPFPSLKSNSLTEKIFDGIVVGGRERLVGDALDSGRVEKRVGNEIADNEIDVFRRGRGRHRTRSEGERLE